MILENLLAHFDNHTMLHIDVNDVRDRLVAMGVEDQILFHFVKMDKDRIRGLLHRYIKTNAVYGEPQYCSDILIPVDMGEEQEAWQRLVAVKEMLHITDSEPLSAESSAAVDNLFTQFSLPPELRDDKFDGPGKSFLNDRVRIYAALAVLVPCDARDILRPLYVADKLSDREIAEIAKVPIRYIPTIMAESFDAFIGAIIGWEKKEEGEVK